MINENWVRIIGFNNAYEVSNLGNVKNIITGKILKHNVTAKGYHLVVLYNGSDKVNRRGRPVHILVAEAFIPNELKNIKNQVNHKDGNKSNNSVDNLEWVTCSENIKHAYKSGLKSNHGDKNPFRIFTSHQVLEIRKMNVEGQSIRQIANHFKSRYDTVWRIIKRKNWKTI